MTRLEGLTAEDVNASLERMRGLKAGWGGEPQDEPPTGEALNWTMRVAPVLLDMNPVPVRLEPFYEGVCWSWRRGRLNASLEFYNESGALIACTSNGEGKIDVWEIGRSDVALEVCLQRIAAHLET